MDIFLIKASSGFTSRNEFQLNTDFRVHLVLDIMLWDDVELDFGQARSFSLAKVHQLGLSPCLYKAERFLNTVGGS